MRGQLLKLLGYTWYGDLCSGVRDNWTMSSETLDLRAVNFFKRIGLAAFHRPNMESKAG